MQIEKPHIEYCTKMSQKFKLEIWVILVTYSAKLMENYLIDYNT